MSREELQRRIGFLFFVVAIVSLTVNLVLQAQIADLPISVALTSPITVGILIFAGVYLVSAMYTGLLGRVLQLGALFSFSVLQILQYYLSVFGVGFSILAMLLAYRYGMLERCKKTKIVLALVVIATLTGYSAAMHGVQLPIGVGIVVFNSILYLVVFGVASWFAFEEEIRSLGRRLNLEIEHHKRAVKISEHTGGLVHNLRNDLNLINAGIELNTINPERFTMDDLKSRVQRLSERVDRIMYAVKLSNMQDEQSVEVNWIVASVVEAFQVESRFRKTLRVELLPEVELQLMIAPADLSQMLENVIENAYHAVMEHKQSLDARQEVGRIRIRTYRDHSGLHISVQDNGCGLRFTDPEQFRLGRTSKRRGSGYGMVYVRDTLATYNGHLQLETCEPSGTVVTLSFPLNRVRNREQESDRDETPKTPDKPEQCAH